MSAAPQNHGIPLRKRKRIAVLPPITIPPCDYNDEAQGLDTQAKRLKGFASGESQKEDAVETVQRNVDVVERELRGTINILRDRVTDLEEKFKDINNKVEDIVLDKVGTYLAELKVKWETLVGVIRRQIRT